MKHLLILLSFTTILLGEHRLDFDPDTYGFNVSDNKTGDTLFTMTPALLIEGTFIQGLQYGDDFGNFIMRDVEFGFSFSIKNKLTGMINFATSEYNVQRSKAYLTYAINDNITLSSGVLTTNFGILKFNSISYPLIYTDLETIRPAIMMQASNDVVYGAFAMYQGVQTDNFLSLAPAVGVLIGDIADIKVSSRIEFENNKSYTDISIGMALTFNDKIEIKSEYITELNSKEIPIDDSTTSLQRTMGFFAEIAYLPTENWILATRYDQRIDNYTLATQSGEKAIELSGRYTVYGPFSVGLALTTRNKYVGKSNTWKPEMKIIAAFEL